MKKGYKLYDKPDHYLLKHHSGDELKVAKKGLSPGGHEMLKMACGGVAHYNEGTPEIPVTQEDAPIQQQEEAQPVSQFPNEPPGFENSIAGRFLSGLKMGTGTASERANKYLNKQEPKPQKTTEEMPVPTERNTNAAVNQPVNSHQQPNQMANQFANTEKQYQDINNQILGGMQQQANIVNAQAKEEANLKGQQIQEFMRQQEGLQGNLEKIQQHISATEKEVHDGTIDPNRIWNNADTGGKILQSIGMILGGMHAGSPMNQIIDRDIEAQKVALGSKKTALESYLREYGNVRDAASALRLNYMAVAHAQMEQAALKQAGPLAQQNFLIASGELKKKMLQEGNELATRQWGFSQMGDSQGQDPSKQLRAMQMAGIIDKDQYKEGNKELGQAQEVEKLRTDFQKSFNDLNSRFLAGKLSPENRNSAINAFAGRIAKLAEGRFNLEESKLQAQALLPGIESQQTRANKQARLNQFFDSMHTTPTLNGLGINVKKQSMAVPR